jgi:hypothetical protein
VLRSDCRASERLKHLNLDANTLRTVASVTDNSYVLHLDRITDLSRGLLEGSACPSDNCGKSLFDRRASATAFVRYLKKI